MHERNGLTRKIEKQASAIAQLREQLKISLEHWEMYEEFFVDAEREAFDAASAVLELSGEFGEAGES